MKYCFELSEEELNTLKKIIESATIKEEVKEVAPVTTTATSEMPTEEPKQESSTS
jgi:hypothetical protein